MTIAAELETRIGRPLPAVYDELVAVERFPEWLIASGIVGVQRLDPGPIRPGLRLRIDQRVAGRASTVEAVVAVLEPGARFALEGRDRDGVKIQIDALTWADTPVTTILRWSIGVSLPLRFRMLEGMIAPQAQRAVALDLEAFKRRMESVAEG